MSWGSIKLIRSRWRKTRSICHIIHCWGRYSSIHYRPHSRSIVIRRWRSINNWTWCWRSTHCWWPYRPTRSRRSIIANNWWTRNTWFHYRTCKTWRTYWSRSRRSTRWPHTCWRWRSKISINWRSLRRSTRRPRGEVGWSHWSSRCKWRSRRSHIRS